MRFLLRPICWRKGHPWQAIERGGFMPIWKRCRRCGLRRRVAVLEILAWQPLIPLSSSTVHIRQVDTL